MNFTCANHSHKFELINRNNGWRCNGGDIYGSCKSGFDQFNKSFGYERFKCTVCADFDLCRKCLEAPAKTENTFKCLNHGHPFKKIDRDNGWRCNGGDIYGSCKSGFDQFNKSFGYERFKCTVCADFDLCRKCLEAPAKTESTYQCLNHGHAFKKINRDNGWRCNGGDIYGSCKSGFDQFNKSFGYERFKCTVCADFDLCRKCLEAPKCENHILDQKSQSQNAIRHDKNNNNINSKNDDDERTCCICLSNTINATLVHQQTGIGHYACCLDCANDLKSKNMTCPICRQNIDLVIKTY